MKMMPREVLDPCWYANENDAMGQYWIHVDILIEMMLWTVLDQC